MNLVSWERREEETKRKYDLANKNGYAWILIAMKREIMRNSFLWIERDTNHSVW